VITFVKVVIFQIFNKIGGHTQLNLLTKSTLVLFQYLYDVFDLHFILLANIFLLT